MVLSTLEITGDPSPESMLEIAVSLAEYHFLGFRGEAARIDDLSFSAYGLVFAFSVCGSEIATAIRNHA